MLASDSHSNLFRRKRRGEEWMAIYVTVPLEALAQIEVIKLRWVPSV